MFLPRIDANGFIDAVTNAPLIAFQPVKYGWAVAAPQNFAFYAPMSHPGGGNLDNRDDVLGGSFTHRLAGAFLLRAERPALRTLRPTAKPLTTVALQNYLSMIAAGEILSFDDAFKKASGDDPAVIEFQTQVVIQAIEEHGRPDLQAVMSDLKLGAMSDALDLVINHAESARELCEVGPPKPELLRLHLMQSVQAMKSALEMMLKP